MANAFGQPVTQPLAITKPQHLAESVAQPFAESQPIAFSQSVTQSLAIAKR